MDTDRWEYLVSVPYRVRHAIAEHFCSDLPTVIDIGAYRTPLRLPYVISVDPLGTIPTADHCTIAEWVSTHAARPAGVVMLGIDLPDRSEEWAVLELVEHAQVVVAEVSLDHVLGVELFDKIRDRITPVVDISFDYGPVDSVGFVPHPRRRMIVGTRS